RGYWVRATESGEITLTAGTLTRKDSFVNRFKDANVLTFLHNDQSTDLYFGKEIPEDEHLSYSLPPVFPGMDFDARFTGDMKYVIDNGEIELMSATETITIAYNIKVDTGENNNWVLSSKTGVDYILEGTGELTIPSIERFSLNKKPAVPTVFMLHQNFPNPFNPITTLRYDLPSDALVTLSIYDMLGREIAQLVKDPQEAGFKSIQWDATDSMGRPVSAGVYLYQIQAGEFVQTKKMVLLK
ncbi:uncharacterized protein METZ01_LOCUS409627, partial [marine metagenome]